MDAFASLPGIGRKTALRLVLHLLKESPEAVAIFGDAVVNMRHNIQFCTDCHNVSDGVLCSICANPRRDRATVCVVESLRDVLAIENTGQYSGLYHILGGVISPIEGIGPEQLNIGTLVSRVQKGEIKELIMAVSPTIEGETTIYYLSKLLKSATVQVSALARGIAFGGELEYADEVTLARSIVSRRLIEE